MPRLRHGSTTAGEVAFWARVNDRPTEWAAAISNLRIVPATTATRRVEPAAAPAGYVTRWDIAGPLQARDGVVDAVPAGLDGTPAAVEESGLLNLNARFTARAPQGRFTAFARTVVDARSAGRALAGIGYTDDVTVFVNGEPVYSGINGWDTRTPALVSFVKADFERVWLPLKPGPNEIVLAVSDDQRFGWGLAMKIFESADD